MTPLESLGTVSCSHFVATMAISLAVCEIFIVKKNGMTLKTGLGVVQGH